MKSRKSSVYFATAVIVMLALPAYAAIEDGLVNYWQFDEGSGNTTQDLGPRGYDGTLTTGVTWRPPGSSDDIRTYIDGQCVGSSSCYDTSLSASENNLWFGSNPYSNATGDSYDLQGIVDEVAVWNRGLTSTEIAEAYNLGVAGTSIPEPATVLLLGLGSMVFLRNRTFRLRK